MHPLESSARKLQRAQKHFDDLQRKVITFIQSNPYHTVSEPHPDRLGHTIYKLKPVRELSGEMNDIGDIFGEFVVNLRGALDNAAFAIAVVIGKPDTKNAYFPFAGALENWSSAIGRCADLPPEIQSLFFGFQPYFGGDDLLSAINAACNTDKHRSVLPAASVFARREAFVSGTRFFEMPIEHKWDRAENEMVLIMLGPGEPVDIKYHFHFKIFVELSEIQAIAGQEILGIADAMGHKVESILAAIEAECVRLKIFV